MEMKDLLPDQYVLSNEQMNAMVDAIGQQFDLDRENISILVGDKVGAGYRHLDIAIGSNESETCFVSLGCSAKKIRKKEWRDTKWFSPFVEIYLKFKAQKSKIDKDLRMLYGKWIKMACYNHSMFNPLDELNLLNGYEYMVIAGDKVYHNHKGYWGMLICPQFRKAVDGMGDVLFYQLIPAYKEELEFIDRYSEKVNYHDLCQAIVNHIDDRQYFDVRYKKLTEEELNSILTSAIGG